jgi:murein DD-endopeptidase MepM/ murein hydrolase activator NlpD
MLSRKTAETYRSVQTPSLLVLAKRKYEKNYVKKVKTDSGEVRIYDDAHVKKRWKKKVQQINALKKKLPKLQKKYREDLKSDDIKVRALAAVVAILDLTAMRIGNDGSVDEFGTFGATTLKKKHVKISGNSVKFKFVGKKGVDQDFSLKDAGVASVLKELSSGKSGNDFIFEYDDGRRIRAKVVNRYLADFDITAKDLRGFHANRLMKEELRGTKDFDKALDNVAEEVGHEAKTLMNQYLDPALVKKYKKAEAPSISSYINAELSRILGISAPLASPRISRRRESVRPDEPAADERIGGKGELAGGQRITSGFGLRKHPISGEQKFHDGIDIGAPEGAEVYALAGGVVIRAEDTGGAAGNMVHIRHGVSGETETQYMHLSKILVSRGQRVSRGDLIGLVGKTGRVTGPHLHLVLKHKSKPHDPTKFLQDRIVVRK